MIGERAASARTAAARLGEPPRRALLAVSEPRRRDALALALVREGVGVLEVPDGLELLELLGAELGRPGGWYPQTIFVDARLPHLDGLDALAEVRELDTRVRAVVLAAADDQEARTSARRLDADLVDLLAPPELIAARMTPR